jgi:hypothetical protein
MKRPALSSTGGVGGGAANWVGAPAASDIGRTEASDNPPPSAHAQSSQCENESAGAAGWHQAHRPEGLRVHGRIRSSGDDTYWMSPSAPRSSPLPVIFCRRATAGPDAPGVVVGNDPGAQFLRAALLAEPALRTGCDRSRQTGRTIEHAKHQNTGARSARPRNQCFGGCVEEAQIQQQQLRPVPVEQGLCLSEAASRASKRASSSTSRTVWAFTGRILRKR